MSAAGTGRTGFTLPELLVGLVVAGMISSAALGLLAAQLRLARDVGSRTTAAHAVRVASTVLSGELRRMAGQDLRALGRDSIAIRAFRGSAIPCARSGQYLVVRYRGDRLPDPGKDSVVVISASAAESVVRLAEVRPATGHTCTVREGELAAAWSLAPAADSAAFLLLFEAGSYYLSGSALRYRLGAEGRQPVTAELLAQPPTGFVTASASGVRLILATDTVRLRALFHSFGTPLP
jgi:prepilin-type N-terminal cleavage/methylation domain-containing protein